jgi:hypothetical protein
MQRFGQRFYIAAVSGKVKYSGKFAGLIEKIPLIVVLLLAMVSPTLSGSGFAPQEDEPQGPPYHAPDGSPQPDTCNGEEHDHPCHCMRNDSDNCPMPGDKSTPIAGEPGYKCKTYCRKDACGCSMQCGS